MNFEVKDLIKAYKQGIISEEQFTALVEYLKQNKVVVPAAANMPVTKKKFTIENFLYYFGALLIIIAMGWYLGNVWTSFGEGGLLTLTFSYALIFTVVGNILWKNNKKTPGGLLYVCAVSVVPLMVWAFERLVGIMPADIKDYSGFHIWVRSGYILMELATIFAGLAFLKFRKFPFLTLPICYAMWYLSMDIVPLCVGNYGEPTWLQRYYTSLVFAILMLGTALRYDKKYEEDFSGWLYVFGSTMFWIVVVSLLSHYNLFKNEFVFLLFGAANFIYMIISILLQRKIFMVWGAFGVVSYLGHLAYTLFKDSALFPFALIIFGLAIIFGGIYYAKNCEKFENKLRNFILGKN